MLLNLASIVSYGARGHTSTLLRAKRDAVIGLPAMIRARRVVMREAAFDRSTFDVVLRRGARVLVRETRS